MKNDNWVLLGRLEQGGHRLFRCRLTDKVAIADNSGMWPDTADDGVFWLDQDRPATLDWHEDGTMRLRMPVRADRGEGNYATMGTWKSVVRFIKLSGLPLIRGVGIDELFELLLATTPEM